MRHVAEYNKYASMYICEEMKTGDGMLSGPSILSKYVITGHVIFFKILYRILSNPSTTKS